MAQITTIEQPLIPGSEDDLLSPSVAARELGVAAVTVRLWETQGKIPAIKSTDGRRLFRRSDIDDLKRKRANRGAKE